MPNKNYASTRYSGLDTINADERQEPEGRMVLFHGRPSRPRRRDRWSSAARCTSHTPFPNIVYALDLTKEGAPVKWKYTPKQDPKVDPRRLLRHGQSRRGVRERQDLQEPARHHDGRARCRDRQGAVEGQAGRLQAGPDDHRRAAGDQGQGDLRHQRRRVRRPRIRHRQRRQHRQAGLADVQHRAGSGSRLPGIRRDLEGRRVEARRRHDVGLVQLRPGAQSPLLRHR